MRVAVKHVGKPIVLLTVRLFNCVINDAFLSEYHGLAMLKVEHYASFSQDGQIQIKSGLLKHVRKVVRVLDIH